jgi:hypothetical protein
MATENNKNISYTNQSDLFKKKKNITDVNTKFNIKNKIVLFINAIKVKHT